MHICASVQTHAFRLESTPGCMHAVPGVWRSFLKILESLEQKCFMLQAAAIVVPSRIGSTRDEMKSNSHDEWLKKKRRQLQKFVKSEKRITAQREAKSWKGRWVYLSQRLHPSSLIWSLLDPHVTWKWFCSTVMKDAPMLLFLLWGARRNLWGGLRDDTQDQPLLEPFRLQRIGLMRHHHSSLITNWTNLSVSLPNAGFCFSDSPSGEHYWLCVNCRSD